MLQSTYTWNVTLYIQFLAGLCLSLKNLEILDLSANDITSVPSGLSSLKSLYLSNCQLTSQSIFSTSNTFHIRNFHYLFRLKNIFNCYSYVYLDISRFTSLEILDLSSNQLNERIPWHQGLLLSFQNYIKIRHLFLLVNKFIRFLFYFLILQNIIYFNPFLCIKIMKIRWKRLK